MPDLGLMQGAPLAPRASRESVGENAVPRAASVIEVAAPFLAPVEKAIAVVSAPWSSENPPAAGAVIEAAAPLGAIIATQTPILVSPSSMANDPPRTPMEPPPAPAAVSAAPPPWRARDLWLLGLTLLVLIATGIGCRDPWPADEPRFAAIARDMVMNHDWLFPRVGADLYADKPPLYFWLLALCYSLVGSVKWSFLIPSFLASCGIVLLVYDYGRRAVSREAGFAAAMLTACTIQFVLVTRAAQIDATLAFLTTLSLYGFLRHLSLGPSWRWYFVGGFAAGLGVFTKGVGFLPLLTLIPYFILRARHWRGLATVDAGAGGWRWWLAPLAMLLAIALWFVPMLVAVSASGAPEYANYRHEILFHQTVGRYAASWHHVQSWYYFIVEVIPPLWLPGSLLLFWLVPRFRDAWRERDARVWLPLTWVLLVTLFFSLSPGKRGIYIHPALPGFMIASMPALVAILGRAAVRRAGFALAAVLFIAALTVTIGVAIHAPWAVKLLADANLGSNTPLLAYLALCGIGFVIAARVAPLAAWPVALGSLAVVFSFWIAPAMNAERSGSGFVRRMLAQIEPDETLALVAYKEQFLLYLDRPTVNFGHRRWMEGPQESYDASAWLNAGDRRVLLVPKSSLDECFKNDVISVGRSSDEEWFLVRGHASVACASKGNAKRAISYRAPI